MQYVLLDIGSSSVKGYLFDKEVLTPLFYNTILFKDGFDPEKGITQDKKQQLIALLQKAKNDYPQATIRTYATALFRKLSESAAESLSLEIQEKTGIALTIISQDEENEYLEHALVGKFNSPKRVILINIGGGSTEIVIVQKQRMMQRQNVDMGVGTIMGMFPDINEDMPSHAHEKMVHTVKRKLPELDLHADVAINSGGELTWMKLGEYALVPNTLFSDTDHPVTVSVEDYMRRNKEIFETLTLSDLEALMPENAKWMHGARSYNVLSEAICITYGIKTLVPSDSNLMHGVVRKIEKDALVVSS